MMSPRIIVRATVAALGVAVIAGSAFVAQASEDLPDMFVGRSLVVSEVLAQVTGTLPNASTATGYETASVRSSKTASTTAETGTHRNVREARSKRAKDLKGYAPSTYTGKFYNPKAENYRACVTNRESRNTYTGVGGGDLNGDGKGDYQGAYQLSPALSQGVTWMMAKESKKADDGLLSEVRDLRDIPASKWSRYWQDRAFWTVLNWEDTYSGAKHWAIHNSRCIPGM